MLKCTIIVLYDSCRLYDSDVYEHYHYCSFSSIYDGQSSIYRDSQSVQAHFVANVKNCLTCTMELLWVQLSSRLMCLDTASIIEQHSHSWLKGEEESSGLRMSVSSTLLY